MEAVGGPTRTVCTWCEHHHEKSLALATGSSGPAELDTAAVDTIVVPKLYRSEALDFDLFPSSQRNGLSESSTTTL